MRKILPLVAAAAAGLVIARRAQAQRREADLWADVTDTVPQAPAAAGVRTSS